MYEIAYRSMLEETAEQVRTNELRAFDRSIALLRSAQRAGRGSREAVEALVYVSRLWAILLEDLAAVGNGLPDSLKASLISIGIWILRRAEEMRQYDLEDFSSLIEVSEIIRNGLGQHRDVYPPEAG